MQSYGLAARTFGYMSARIGEADSTFADGLISHSNSLALTLGALPGKSCREVMDKLSASQ